MMIICMILLFAVCSPSDIIHKNINGAVTVKLLDIIFLD